MSTVSLEDFTKANGECEVDCDKPAIMKWRGKNYCEEHADIAMDMDWNPKEDEQA